MINCNNNTGAVVVMYWVSTIYLFIWRLLLTIFSETIRVTHQICRNVQYLSWRTPRALWSAAMARVTSAVAELVGMRRVRLSNTWPWHRPTSLTDEEVASDGEDTRGPSISGSSLEGLDLGSRPFGRRLLRCAVFVTSFTSSDSQISHQGKYCLVAWWIANS